MMASKPLSGGGRGPKRDGSGEQLTPKGKSTQRRQGFCGWLVANALLGLLWMGLNTLWPWAVFAWVTGAALLVLNLLVLGRLAWAPSTRQLAVGMLIALGSVLILGAGAWFALSVYIEMNPINF